MIYLWPQASSMADMPPGFGVITAPATNTISHGIREGRPWAMDNGAFTGAFDIDTMMALLKRHEPYRDNCLFVVVPDVVGNAITTLHLYRNWLHHFDGWPVAFVAQDGQENLPLPNYYDWLFVGGSTEWKLSPRADSVIQRAKQDGKPVHVGRVNSIKRFRHFQLVNVDSVDGTTAAFAPDRSRAVLGRAVRQPELIRLADWAIENVPDLDCIAEGGHIDKSTYLHILEEYTNDLHCDVSDGNHSG